jgi:hypothetical protein
LTLLYCAFAGQDEMEEMIAESRLVIASECLAAAEYENARLAYNAALQLSPHGPRAQEARRGLDQAEKGLKLERAAVDIAPIVDNFRQSLAVESADDAASDAVLEVQQAMNSVLGVELSASIERAPGERLQYLCVHKAGVTASLDYDPQEPRMVAYYAEGEVVTDVVKVQQSSSGKTRFLTAKGWCSVVSESGVILFEAIDAVSTNSPRIWTAASADSNASSNDGIIEKALANAEETAAFHGEMLQAMASQIKALTEENTRLRLQLEQGQPTKPAA